MPCSAAAVSSSPPHFCMPEWKMYAPVTTRAGSWESFIGWCPTRPRAPSCDEAPGDPQRGGGVGHDQPVGPGRDAHTLGGEVPLHAVEVGDLPGERVVHVLLRRPGLCIGVVGHRVA